MNDKPINQFVEHACAVNCALVDQHYIKSIEAADGLINDFPDIPRSNIVTACLVGDHQHVSKLVDSDAAIASRKFGPRDWPPLLYLCFSRYLRQAAESMDDDQPLDPERVEDFLTIAGCLIEHGADVNSFFMLGDERETCLYGACGVVNCGPLARLLLENGADPNDEDASYHVSESKNTDCIAALLEHGMDANRQATVLLRKLDFNDLSGTRFILEQGVDPNETGVWGKTAVHQAIIRGRRIAFLELLAEFGADLQKKNSEGHSPLYLASIHGRQDVVEWLRKQDVVESLCPEQRFLAACGLGFKEKAQLELEKNPGLFDRISKQEKQIFTLAGRAGNCDAIRTMLELGFEIDIQDGQGFSALHWAAWYGHVELVELLIKNHAPLGLKNNYGGTVLDTAAWGYANSDGNDENCEVIFCQLVEAGADLAEVTPFPTGNSRVDDALRSLGGKK